MSTTFLGKTEIAIRGRFCKIAKLRHEWCEFVPEPLETIRQLRKQKCGADVFTFAHDIYDTQPAYSFRKEFATAAILKVTTYEKWWNETLNFKVRNKVKKAQKIGVELRLEKLSDEFAKGVEVIYNESPIRQGKKFWHYGKTWQDIRADLSTFEDNCTFIGAYHQGELIGFAKLYHGKDLLRTVHIIARLSQRDKPVMDLLIAKSVELCEQRRISHLQYGSWSRGGLGDFKIKHGFEEVRTPRYFAPLNLKGALMLKFNLHQPLRQRLPETWVDRLVAFRRDWNARWYGTKESPRKELAPERPVSA
jgi:hypothetical protein